MEVNKTILSMSDVARLAGNVAHAISAEWSGSRALRVYGIPRGGVPAAFALGNTHISVCYVDSPDHADLFIDDILDTGRTRDYYKGLYPNIPFYALVNKENPLHREEMPGWVVFPWEGSVEAGITDNITRILEFIGDKPEREGLLETPNRVAKALQFWFSGYDKDPKDILKTFKDGGEKHSQMITVQDIPIYSKCEHHMADIFGTATISYIPNGKIVGLSKLSRLADIFARRLQVQERLTDQIADALMEGLEPLGVGVVLKCRHMCMESRGICQQGHRTITTALRGVILNQSDARAEFMRLV